MVKAGRRPIMPMMSITWGAARDNSGCQHTHVSQFAAHAAAGPPSRSPRRTEEVGSRVSTRRRIYRASAGVARRRPPGLRSGVWRWVCGASRWRSKDSALVGRARRKVPVTTRPDQMLVLTTGLHAHSILHARSFLSPIRRMEERGRAHPGAREAAIGREPHHRVPGVSAHVQVPGATDVLNRVICSSNSRAYLPRDICSRLDSASMANSLECRSPFLDHKLIECRRTTAARRLQAVGATEGTAHGISSRSVRPDGLLTQRRNERTRPKNGIVVSLLPLTGCALAKTSTT